jgi:bla regulator protein BlaR1
MLQAMLADRFQLRLRHEMKEVSAYDLVRAKNGPKFKPNTDLSARPDLVISADAGGMHVKASNATMARLTVQLAFSAGRPVVDKTGLTGGYAFTLDWAPDNSPAAVDGSAPTLFTAIQEQLGLKLDPSRTTQQMLIIESAERPSAN